MNRRIWNWFDNAYFHQALCGEGDFFIPEITYRDEHDQTLIVDQLFQWAKGRDRERDAAEALEQVIAEYASSGDIIRASRLVLIYMIVADERGETLGIQREDLASSLATLIARHPETVVSDEGARQLVLSVAARLPELQGLLHLPRENPGRNPIR